MAGARYAIGCLVSTNDRVVSTIGKTCRDEQQNVMRKNCLTGKLKETVDDKFARGLVDIESNTFCEKFIVYIVITRLVERKKKCYVKRLSSCKIEGTI